MEMYYSVPPTPPTVVVGEGSKRAYLLISNLKCTHLKIVPCYSSWIYYHNILIEFLASFEKLEKHFSRPSSITVIKKQSITCSASHGFSSIG